MTAARAIHLRRPAVLSIQEGVFVPQGSPTLMNEIDRRWGALCSSNPAYYDGRLYHVLGVHRNGHGGATLHVMDCAYRYFAVQDDQFDTGVRPLGLKGLVMRDGRYLMGLRSQRVGVYRGMWEFAPGGTAEPGTDPAQVIQRELQEETGLQSAREPTSVAIMFDPVLRCWEIVWRLTASDGEPKPRRAEYDQLQWCQLADLPVNLSPIARQIAEFLHKQSASSA